MRIRPAIAVLCTLLLAACGAGASIDSPEAQVVRAKNDPFLPYYEFVGAELRHKEATFTHSLRLVAHKDRKTGALATYAQVEIEYNSDTTHHYEQARNEQAEPLKMRKVDALGGACRKAGGCKHKEVFMVDLPEAELRAARKTGYKIKLFARTGYDAYFPIPWQLVDALYKQIGPLPDVDGEAAKPTAIPKTMATR